MEKSIEYIFVEAKYGDEFKYACIDKNGVIQFVLEGRDRPYTDFSGGTALVYFIEDSKAKQKLVNTKGEVITSPSLAGYDEIVIPPMAYSGKSADLKYVGINGYYIAKRSIDTFEKTTTEFGILAADDSWAIGPNDEISVIDYAGDGIYVIFYKDTNAVDKIFDTKTGELLDAVNANILIQDNIILTNGYLVIRDNENKVKRIREIWVSDRESQANDAFEEVQLREGIIAYKDYNTPSNIHLIEIQRDKDKGDFDYAKTFLYEDGKLIFAYYEGVDSHRMYFRNNDMFRWRYCSDANNSGDYLNYDQCYEEYQFQYWATDVFIESLTWYTKA